MTEVMDEDGTNASASAWLDEHHDVVGERDKEGYLDNCERCGFAVGWVQPTSLGPDHCGHATSCSTAEVQAWAKKEEGA